MPPAKHWTEYPTEMADTGCLRWLGPKRNAYGRWRKKTIHRVVWEESFGPIPDGLVLDHVHARGCRYTDCINLDHLEPVPQSENARRMPHIQAQLSRTRCIRGHALSDDNLINRADGKRGCRQCAREAAALSYQKRRSQ